MQPGRVLGNRFEIAAVAGQGGMGVVFRARDTLTGALVAVKVLRAAAGSAVRFSREARVLAELRHPAIVHYVAHGETEAGEPFLAMEWLDGEDLATRLERQPLRIEEALALAERIADALAVVHARGVIHRDLKPSNLFLVEGDVAKVKLLDFGIARLAHTAKVTRTGATVGTPGYMAPEQARGARAIDARVDVFSLGCVLFETLAGQPPFVADHVMAVLAKILFEEAPRLGDLCPGLPGEVVDLVHRMLAKDPAQRPSDGRAVREELSRIDAAAIVGEARSSQRRAPAVAPAALTHEGQELVSVVVAAAPRGAAGDAVAATLPVDAAGVRESMPAQPLQRPSLGDALVPFGARLEWLADGSAIAVMTAHGAATDQAVRAARCALAMRRFLPEAALVVATGRGVLAGKLPIGEVIGRAVRELRSLVPADERESPSDAKPPTRVDGVPIGLDEVTAGLLPARFVVIKGPRGPELRGERDTGDAARTLLGRPSPFVGRRQEVTLLMTLVHQAVDDRVPRVALVTAAAGVGKSRLREELVREVQRGELGEVAIWMAVGDPMRAGAPLGLVTDALRRVFGLVDDEPVEASRRKIRERVVSRLPGHDAARVSEFVGEICGVRSPEDESVELGAARVDLMLMGEQMRRAWVDLLRAEAAIQPILFVLEDLQWGDVPTSKYVDAALRELRDSPLMVLALARPEVDEQFPKLWTGRGLTRVDLGELSPRSCEQLVRQVLGQEPSSETVARLVRQSAGNAFYLEELIRAVAEGDGGSLPGTVMAMVQARLAALEDGARRVLRGASVFGQVFWRGGVSMLFGGEGVTSDIHEWLDDLADREIISTRGEGRFRGDMEYEFRHAVVRDAAYALLTDEDLTLGHRLAGHWLEQRGEREAAVLAEHFERGGEGARAVEQYRRAAAHALEGNDLDGAVASAERGVVCGAEAAALGALRLLQAEAHYFRGRHADAHRAGRAALEALDAGSAAWYTAVATTVAAGDKAGDASAASLVEALVAAEPSADTVVAYVTAAARCATHLLTAGRSDLAEALIGRIADAEAQKSFTEPIVAGRIHLARAVRALFRGEPATYLELVSRAADEFERAGDMRTACAARGNAGHACAELGAYDRAERTLRDVLAVATRSGLDNVVGWVSHNLGLVLAHRGHFAEARDVEQRALDAGVAQGDRRLQLSGRIALARIHGIEGDAQRAETALRAVLPETTDAPAHRVQALAILAAALNAQGRSAEASAQASAGMELLASVGGADADEALLRLAHAEALHGCGERARARSAIAEARDRIVERAQRVSDPSLRESFLNAVAAHATTMALATAWRADG